jgi:hypothetical protein
VGYRKVVSVYWWTELKEGDHFQGLENNIKMDIEEL